MERTWDEAQPISEEEKTIQPRREEKNEIRRTRGNARNQKSPGSWEETAAVKECICRRLEELWFAGCGGCFRLSTSLRGDSQDGTQTGQQRPRVYEVKNTEGVQKGAASSWVGGMQDSSRPKDG